MPTSTPIPVTPATRMRIATMYTGAGAMDYGYVRASRDDDANANATMREGKSATSFSRVCDDRRTTTRARARVRRRRALRMREKRGDRVYVPA